MQTPSTQEIHTAVRTAYGAIAAGNIVGGCCGTSGCGCDADGGDGPAEASEMLAGADLTLGCGNPHAIAALKPGERVLDLGSGPGFDAMLAARQVGETGSVIGVDLTPEMVRRATATALKAGFPQVEFRLGDIEHVPVVDASIDVVMSNCVINIAPDKAAVFREAFRVLAPGGRLAISDMVAVGDLAEAVRADPSAYAGCVAGAARPSELERLLTGAGFVDLRIQVSSAGPDEVVAAALIEGTKPAKAAACCGPSRQATCCAPSEKSSCCGTSAATGTCGCQGA